MRHAHHFVAALFLTVTIPAFAADPVPSPRPAGPHELTARIDAFIEAALSARGVTPAPLASDAEFQRRVYLDLAGRIPTEAEARAFLADTAPDRRARLVETLLNSPDYVRHMSSTWQIVMAPSTGGNVAGFRSWLESRVRQNAPFDAMVRDLLTAPMFNVAGRLVLDANPVIANPGIVNPTIKKLPFNPANFNPNNDIKLTPKPLNIVQINNVLVSGPEVSPGAFFFEAHEYKPEELAASTARRFLGVRLECAQCHDHPFANWTRTQFWEFAAFFSGVQAPAWNFYITDGFEQIMNKVPLVATVPVNTPPPGRTIAIPKTSKIAEARFPDGTSPAWKDNLDGRQALAEWLTSPANPYFARTAANRLWAHFFGIGIIDPVDDEPNPDNPASHPELLADLTKELVANKFDVKSLIRAITASRAYQRTSAATHESQNQPRLFARMAVKGLTPEQLFDSLALATGFQDPSGHPPGVIVPNTPRGEFLLMFATQDSKTATQTSILQALTLMNGKLVTDATSVTGTHKLATLIHGAGTNADKLESLYLSTLSRLPRPEETGRLLRYVDSRPDAAAALSDVYWALLNSSEFRFNH